MPRLLPREQIPAGAALTMLTMHISVIGRPAARRADRRRRRPARRATSSTRSASSPRCTASFRLPPMRPEGEAAASRPARRRSTACASSAATGCCTGALLADLSATRAGHADRAVPGDQRRAVRRLAAHARVAHRRPSRSAACSAIGALRTGRARIRRPGGRAGEPARSGARRWPASGWCDGLAADAGVARPRRRGRCDQRGAPHEHPPARHAGRTTADGSARPSSSSVARAAARQLPGRRGGRGDLDRDQRGPAGPGRGRRCRR